MFETIPELLRRYRFAVKEDDDKKTSKLVSSGHGNSISKTVDPFAIIIKQTSELTCLLECVANNEVNSAQVLKGGGT